MKKPSNIAIATAIAILFHLVGLAGILLWKSVWILQSSAFNLLLSAGLLIWTHNQKNKAYWFFVLLCCCTGIAVEVIGVNTGLLFGDYKYGAVLGPQIKAVPWIIGINWFIVIYCCGTTLQLLLDTMTTLQGKENKPLSQRLQSLSVIIDGALLAVAFDWLIEPMAVKLGYWTWTDGYIPTFNYVCWFLISLLLLVAFRLLRFNKGNKFAVHLLLIQAMFFLLLRTFY